MTETPENGTLTIQKNGTTVQTFTANQSTNVTADITTDTWTAVAYADASMNIVFDDLSDSYGYDLYADDVLVSILSMTKGTGTNTGIKLTYEVDSTGVSSGVTPFYLRILK